MNLLDKLRELLNPYNLVLPVECVVKYNACMCDYPTYIITPSMDIVNEQIKDIYCGDIYGYINNALCMDKLTFNSSKELDKI